MDRLKLLLMPLKHQPDFIYLRHVPLRRVHLFTFLQVLCLALLWILKSTVAAIIFPVMVGIPEPPHEVRATALVVVIEKTHLSFPCGSHFFPALANSFDLIRCDLRFLCLWSSTLDFTGKLSWVQLLTLVSPGQGTSLSYHELVAKMGMALVLSFWATMINTKSIARCLTSSRHQCTWVIFKILYNRPNLNYKYSTFQSK